MIAEMPVITDHTKISKNEWISLARSFYVHLAGELKKMSEAEWRSSTRYLGWNCKDLVNHMTSAITINFDLLIQLALDGKPVPPPGFNLFLRNADEVERRRKDSIPKTISEFETEMMKLMDRYDAMTEEQWNTPAFFYIGDVDVRTLFLVQFADNLTHERDLKIANNNWTSFNPRYIFPLMDWFMTSFRPASYKPGASNNESATLQFHIVGDIGGSWYMVIENDKCNVFRGTIPDPEMTVTTTIDDLINTALARSSPLVGKLARAFEWTVRKEKREDFAAKVTGMVAAVTAIVLKKMKVEGDKKKAGRIMKKWFWHFWDRTKQTQENIVRSPNKSF